MLKKLTFREKIHFFFVALKKHIVLYVMGFFFLVSFAGVGLGILVSLKEFDLPSLIGGSMFLFFGVGGFLLIFYLNISSMQYYFNSAVMKKYARYKRVAITNISYEEMPEDGVILSLISVNYEGHILTDVFELSIENKDLLKHLKKKMFIYISIAEQLPSAMRIAPRKLLKQLKEIENENQGTSTDE